jgi:hypothetical protein
MVAAMTRSLRKEARQVIRRIGTSASHRVAAAGAELKTLPRGRRLR